MNLKTVKAFSFVIRHAIAWTLSAILLLSSLWIQPACAEESSAQTLASGTIRNEENNSSDALEVNEKEAESLSRNMELEALPKIDGDVDVDAGIEGNAPTSNIEQGEALSVRSLDLGSLGWSISVIDEVATRRAILTNSSGFTDMLNVKFAVWSAYKGQDDLTWYNAVLQTDGTYTFDIPISSHRSYGDFFIDAYAAVDSDSEYLSSTVFNLAGPSIDSLLVVSQDKTTGSFSLSTSATVNPDLIAEVKIAVWSNVNQENLYWYDMVRQPDSTFQISGSLGYHLWQPGDYIAHAYIIDLYGNEYYAAATGFDMSIERGVITAIPSGDVRTINVSLDGFKVPGGHSNVAFAVWSNQNGQDDLRWYDAKLHSDGSHYLQIPVSNHKNWGLYYIDAYVGSRGGPQYMNTATTTLVYSGSGVLDIYSIDQKTGWFAGRLTGVSSAKDVRVAVWQANDQRDLRWVSLSQNTNGSWVFADHAEAHMRFFGPYNFHVYATIDNGLETCVAVAQADVYPLNYVAVDYISRGKCLVTVYNPNNGDASQVLFPTYAESKGPAAKAWYQGTRNSDGSWSAVIDAQNHAASGGYVTDVQVTSASNGSVSVVNTIKYELRAMDPYLETMYNIAQGYSSATNYLILVNSYTNRLAIFQGSYGNWTPVQFWLCSTGALGTPTVFGEYTVGSRGYSFGSGFSCYWWTQFYGDYLFHSVTYYQNTNVIMEGKLGVNISHGCVRLDINNAKWIYDNIPYGTKVVSYWG